MGVVALGMNRSVTNGIEVLLGPAVLLWIWRWVVELEGKAGFVELQQQPITFDPLGRRKRGQKPVMDLGIVNGAHPAVIPEQLQVIGAEPSGPDLLIVMGKEEIRHQQISSPKGSRMVASRTSMKAGSSSHSIAARQSARLSC